MLLSPAAIVICILVPVVVFLGVKWLLAADTKKEERRKLAMKLAQLLQSYGLTRIPAILLAYSVGDYAGIMHEIKVTVDVFLSGEAAVATEFGKIFERVLKAKLSSPEGIAYIESKVVEAKKIAEDAVKAGNVLTQ